MLFIPHYGINNNQMIKSGPGRKAVYVLFLFVFIPLILLVASFLLVHTFIARNIVVFPASFDRGRLWSYNDTEMNVTALKVEHNAIIFSYKIEKTDPLEFAGMGISLDPWEDEGIDLSSCDYMKIVIASRNSMPVDIFLLTRMDNDNSLPQDIFRSNGFYLDLGITKDKYIIPLKQFTTGDWWFEKYNIDAKRLRRETFRQTAFLQFEGKLTGKNDTEDTIIIDSISFHTSISRVILFSIIIPLSYYLFIFLFIFIFRKKPEGAVIPDEELLSYKKINLLSYKTEDLNRIIAYLQENYSNPDLTIEDAVKSTGVYQSKLYKLIKEEYNMTFKELVYRIRLTEAKRLLVETDRQIADIAYHVGFNDISYFNRLFKKHESLSPREFRLKQQGE